MRPRALIELTEEQTMALTHLFMALKDDPGSAIMAQVFPDGMHVAVLTSKEVDGVQLATGTPPGTVKSALQSFTNSRQRELERTAGEEDHTA